MAPRDYTSLPVIVVLLLFSLVEGVDLYKDITATTWPTTTGDLSYVGIPASISYPNPKFGPIFNPLSSRGVLYSYIVDKKEYESSKKSFGFTFSESIEVIKSITPNQLKVKVYYNKLNPDEAVLIPGQKLPNIFLMLAPILLILWMTRQKKKKGETQQSAVDGLR